MRNFFLAFLIFTGLSAAVISYAIETIGVPPRRWAPYVERRAAGHSPPIVAIGHWIGQALLIADRGSAVVSSLPHLTIGAQPEMALPDAPEPLQRLQVTSIAAAIAAFSKAKPGDQITFAPGRYRFSGQYLSIDHPGAAGRPITVRSAEPGTVVLEFDMTEGFHVSAPYWTFENLTINGVCSDHSNCEHAFHVTGNATHFIARNNTITDFNAHFKINGVERRMPDLGLIEGNTLSNTAVRHTGNPVTIIDLVAASGWMIRKNVLSDFIKQNGNQISYGAFAKGGGSNNVFDNNIVLCEYRLHGMPGQRVGLSFGNGGTGTQYCRDQRCIVEQEGSAMRGNLIASCSDDGIYLNRSATSRLIHNTLIDTGGISVRFPESSADIEGNLVDGRIRARDDAILRERDNLDISTTRLLLGSHPVRQPFDAAGATTFSGVVPLRAATTETDTAPDLCGSAAGASRAYGAFANFADCIGK